MKSENIRFLSFLLLLMAALAGLTLLAKNSLPEFVTPYWYLQLLFFAIVNLTIYFVTTKVMNRNDMSKFTNFYMATTFVKILAYLSVLVTYILIFPEDKKAFVSTFIVYYICFTVYETYILAKKDKNLRV